MNRNRTLAISLFAIALLIVTSCAIVPHPNEKIIVGIWKPVKVEKVIDSSALKAVASKPADTAGRTQKSGKTQASGNGARKGATIDRLVQSEMRASLEVFANKTAVKNYPGKPVHFTWKMKGKGTRLLTKNVETKMKFVIEIETISQDQIVILEHAQVGDVRIAYERQK